MIRRIARGQTLVLFALTLLLLTLMVTITLSIGMKAKEKMELETAADAAAYSQAVATARAYNGISVLNRALMSNMVAMAGVESLISWSSFYWGVVNEVKSGYNIPKAEYKAHHRRVLHPLVPLPGGVHVRHPGRQGHQPDAEPAQPGAAAARGRCSTAWTPPRASRPAGCKSPA